MASRDRRRAKIRKIIQGTKDRPRLVIFRSNRYLYAQMVDDSKGQTVLSIDKMADAAAAGKKLAEDALKIKIAKVVFDRAGYQYHGIVKKFADAAREGGLKF